MFFLDYGGCHGLAAMAYDMGTKQRHKFVKLLYDQKVREKDNMDKQNRKAQR